MQKWRVLLGSLLLIITGFVIWHLYLRQKPQTPAGLVYNTITQSWEETAETNPTVSREEIVPGENSDGLHNYTLLRGYFDRYDVTTNTLTIKAIQPFTNNNLTKLTQVHLNPSQSIYCTPTHYTDPNTGKSYLMKSLTMPVRDGELLFVPTEQLSSFDNFLTRSHELTYLLIQLTSNFDAQVTNYVQKIIAIGICD